MKELAQTVSNTIDFSQNFYDLIFFGNIEFFKSQELRRHVKACKSKEMDRGYRIIKGKHSEKIDIAIAGAMACLGAVRSFTQEQGDEPENIVHNLGEGVIWVEERIHGKEKPFNFPHLTTPEEEEKEKEENFDW